MLPESISRALQTDLTIEITTIGRRSGLPRRIEIWFFVVDGRVFITGPPGRRHWYANLLADPSITLHFKESVVADVPAVATPITEAADRRNIMGEIEPRMRRLSDWAQGFTLEDWLQGSPLVEIVFAGADA